MIRQTSYWITHRSATRAGREFVVAPLPSFRTTSWAWGIQTVRDYAGFIPSTPVLGMILLASVFICATVISRSVAELRRSAAEYQQMTSAVTTTRRTNEALRMDLQRVRSDPSTIESIARSRLGMVRPGDLVIPIR